MVATPSEAYIAALELLSDGKWHPYHEVADALTSTVRPAEAIRRANMKRASSGRRHGRELRPMSRKQLIAYGSKTIIGDVLAGRRFETTPGRGSDKKVRLLPTESKLPQGRSVLFNEAVQLLSDGAWHDYTEVLRQLAKLVPPGVAVRTVEDRRQRQARQRGYASAGERKRLLSTERLIEIGSQEAVRAILCKPRRFEIDPTDPKARRRDKRIRLRMD